MLVDKFIDIVIIRVHRFLVLYLSLKCTPYHVCNLLSFEMRNQVAARKGDSRRSYEHGLYRITIITYAKRYLRWLLKTNFN